MADCSPERQSCPLGKNGDHETIPMHGNRDLGKGLEHKLLKHLEASK